LNIYIYEKEQSRTYTIFLYLFSLFIPYIYMLNHVNATSRGVGGKWLGQRPDLSVLEGGTAPYAAGSRGTLDGVLQVDGGDWCAWILPMFFGI
jgi:hypothetical protein